MLRKAQSRQGNIMKDVTSRTFRGGLNVADSELNLSSKYARVLDNMVVGIDGSIQVRQGSALFADASSLSDGYIIAVWYFAGNIIAVNTVGQVFSVDGTGAVSRIWDSEIAAAKRLGLIKWGSTTFVDFEEMQGQLVLVNGTDKPLVITAALVVDYLADPATGSNINVPIGSLICKHANHMCIATGSILNVSERNAAGTWTGDIGTQFAAIFDMSTYVLHGDTTIIGMSSFKGALLVYFRECTIPLVFTENTSPTISLTISTLNNTSINNYGAITPKSVQDLGEEILSCDIVGIAEVALAKFTLTLSPDRPSRLVDKLLQQRINTLTTSALYNDSFSMYDRRTSTYMMFFPDAESRIQRSSLGFGYHYIDSLNIEAWNTFSGWNWHCGARSSEGNLFFVRNKSNLIFVMGNEQANPLNADFIGEQEVFSDGTTFTDNTGLGPVANKNNSGVPINWTWELPWSDVGHRALVKTLRYVILDTEGTSAFTCYAYVDNIYTNKSYAGDTFSDGTTFTDGSGFVPFIPPLMPALTAQFVAKDRPGFGGDAYGAIYGGGLNTAIARLVEMPTKFEMLKLRFQGSSMSPMKFVALTLMYQLGNIRRMGP